MIERTTAASMQIAIEEEQLRNEHPGLRQAFNDFLDTPSENDGAVYERYELLLGLYKT